MPLSASTQSPESSAMVGSPVAARPARALSSALPSKVGWSSTGSSYAATSSSPSTSTSGRCSRRIRSISASFLALRDARKDARTRHPASASCWSRVRSAQPFSPSTSRASSSARVNAAPSAVPWTSMNDPAPVITMFMSVSARTSSS